jgi:hypothetical protein
VRSQCIEEETAISVYFKATAIFLAIRLVVGSAAIVDL